jgi:hypothetical protein
MKFTCKHVHEIGKTQRFKFFKTKTQRFQKDIEKKKKLFSFSIYLKIVTNFIYESIIQFFFK